MLSDGAAVVGHGGRLSPVCPRMLKIAKDGPECAAEKDGDVRGRDGACSQRVGCGSQRQVEIPAAVVAGASELRAKVGQIPERRDGDRPGRPLSVMTWIRWHILSAPPLNLVKLHAAPASTKARARSRLAAVPVLRKRSHPKNVCFGPKRGYSIRFGHQDRT